MRNSVPALVLLVFALFGSLPAQASVSKTYLGEEFAASWCVFCPFTACALDSMAAEFDLTYFRTDVDGFFDASENDARWVRYSPGGGLPHLIFDGVAEIVGAPDCASAAADYRIVLNDRAIATGGLSPIDLSVEFEVVGTDVIVTGTAELVDDVTLSSLQMTLYVIEDDIDLCCGAQNQSHWDRITRGVRSSPIALTFGGGTVQTQETWAIPQIGISPWEAQGLWVVAVVEEVDAPFEVFQAASFRNDLTISWDQVVASVPDGSGQALITGTIFNGNDSADDFNISSGGDQGGWTYDFQLGGDPVWYTNTTLFLNPGESHAVTLRVTTDAVVVVGKAELAAAAQNSIYSTSLDIRVFNGFPSVMIVDANGAAGSGTEGASFRDALGTLLPTYDELNFPSGGGPANSAAIAGYDCVVWTTGAVGAYDGANPINPEAAATLEAYLAGGGNLLLSSMDFTSSSANTAEVRSYLGLDSFVINSGAVNINGVTGDPITDGMFYVLDWQDPAELNLCDTVNPEASAGGTEVATIFNNEIDESNALRREDANGQRTILNTIWLKAIDQSPVGDDVVVATAMLDWILNGFGGTTDAPSIPGTGFVGTFLRGSPNPYAADTKIQFAISERASRQPATLRIVDATGRFVRNLYQGRLDAGLHGTIWDGRDDDGKEVANGLYLAVLEFADGVTKAKLTRIR